MVINYRLASINALNPVVEPWPELRGGKFVAGHGSTLNPDPLRDYVWNLTDMPNASALQLLQLLPSAVQPSPGAKFSNWSSLVNTSAGSARVEGAGTLLVDFGVELASCSMGGVAVTGLDSYGSSFRLCDYVGWGVKGATILYP